MSKYRNALYYLYDIFRNHKDEISEDDEIDVKKVKRCFDTLEKLVDKATPKKPKGLSICPNCENHLYIDQQYCDKCGTEIDWSDEDE